LDFGLGPKFGLSPNENVDFTFWLYFGVSPSSRLKSSLDWAKD